MASNTDLSLRNSVFYMVFVRNYSPEGTLNAVTADLDRIRALGVDYLWLLPCQPIGTVHRKGSLGSPYAISDYRAVNGELGTMDDFIRLTDECHRRGMKVILDIVYNHTSPDSWLAQTHPAWFYHKPDGTLGNRVGEWWDVVDLDYSHAELWDYQIETLRFWAQYVDGFRCDVAPMVPLEFWKAARAAVEEVRPGAVWIAESVDPAFVRYNRAHGVPTASDGEMYQAFDVLYEYDSYPFWKDAMLGCAPLSAWVDAVNRQEGLFPENYIKLRNLENHDRPRAADLIVDRRALENWTAYLYFAKGATLLYAGQEHAAQHHPTLFDRDPVNWDTGIDLTPLLQKLYAIKKDPIFTDSSFTLSQIGECLYAVHEGRDGRRAVGFFSTTGRPGAIVSPLPEGTYFDELSGRRIDIFENVLTLDGNPVIMLINPV